MNAPLDLLTRLIAAGTAPALVAEVARLEARAAVAEQALEGRRAADRNRQSKRRGDGASRDVTLGDVTARDVTGGHASPSDKEKSPTPSKEINSPAPTNEADASLLPPPGVDDEKQDDGQDRGEGKPPRPARKARKRSVGSRIARDWTPPPVAELPLEAQALVHQWPSGGYEVTALAFLNHWLAEGRAVAAKRSWPRTWVNWLLRENTAMIRAKKAGVTFAVPAPSAGRGAGVDADRLEEVAASFERIGRDGDAAEYRRLAAKARGQAP